MNADAPPRMMWNKTGHLVALHMLPKGERPPIGVAPFGSGFVFFFYPDDTAEGLNGCTPFMFAGDMMSLVHAWKTISEAENEVLAEGAKGVAMMEEMLAKMAKQQKEAENG